MKEYTGLSLNKWFLKKDSWHEMDIKERGEALSQMAAGIWPAINEPDDQIGEGGNS